jgi:hypothetical protein
MDSDRTAAPSLRLSRLALAAAIVLAPPATAAVGLDYEIGASLLHSDNINLSATDPVADTVFGPQLRFDARQGGSDLRLKARGELQHLHYLGNSFPDEWRGGFAGQLEWTLLPQRLEFVAQDYLSRAPVDPFSDLSPGNQQQVNVFIAGPNVFARFGPATRGELELRYGASHADEDPRFNGHRHSAAARVLRAINATSDGSLNLEATRADFDRSIGYTLRNAYAGYVRRHPRLDLDLAAGWSQLLPGNDAPAEGTQLLRATIDWKTTPRSTFSINLRSGFSDATEYLVAHGEDLDAPPPPDLHTGDLAVQIGAGAFRERHVAFGYRHEGDRLRLQLRPYREHIRYLEGIAPEQRSHGGTVQLDYRLRPRTTLSFIADRQQRRFVGLSRDDEDFVAIISLLDRLTRHWSVRFDLQHRQRDSSVADQAHDENAAVLAITYRR